MHPTYDHSKNRAVQIGELADAFGINPKTIRYYEEIGLLPEPSRSPSGYRQYGPAGRERLGFVLKAKATGLTLEEIGQVVALRQNGREPCAHVQTLIDQKIAALDDQIRALIELRQELEDLRNAAQTVSGDPTSDARFCWTIEQHESDRDAYPTLPRFG